MKKYVWVLFLFFSLLFAEEENFLNPCLSKDHDKVYDKRENYFQTSTPYKITPKVNPITGDLIEEEIDLIIAGNEPLSVRRFYNHTAPYEPRTGGWRYNPEFFLVANLEWKGQETFAAVGESSGTITPLKPNSNTCVYHPSKGFIHFDSNGQSHPLNTKINYQKVPDKRKGYFSWKGEVIDGTGTKRSFISNSHCWLDPLITKARRSTITNTLYLTMFTPNCWTPYQFHIYEERRPNGNIICYSTCQWKNKKEYPIPPLLNGITAYNTNKTKILGSISFHYNQDKNGDVHGFLVKGSDGRQIEVQHRGNTPILLSKVTFPDKPSVHYGYQKTSINHVEKAEGRLITTEYNSSGQVKAQYAPVGPKGEMCPIGRYIYQDRNTEVYDAEGNKTIYRFNDNRQLLSLESYKEGSLYRNERYQWDEATGNLLKKVIEDELGNTFFITEYLYDKNHNPIVERIGNRKEWRTINRTFSEDGFNLKLSESDREGKVTYYRYLPHTNLLSHELVYEGKKLRKRAFHFYDDCAICIKTIIDDGQSEDPNDLQGVTYRKITRIVPKQKIPCFALPEIIEEKSIDGLGNEILLHKTIYTYTPFGKVSKEEHYDAKGLFRYQMQNKFDNKECLESTTNQLGDRTTFTYDANHNLTSSSGPKKDQYREITYDKANRPIQIAHLQSDGTILISEKKYDKLGRLIEEIDPCKNSTQFKYDDLSRLVMTIYPDGGIEQKEYDLLGNVIKEIDAKGYETKRSYNCFNQVTSVLYPDGSKERFTYNPSGTIASHSDKNNSLTLYSYDIFDHLIKTESTHKTTTYSWTPFLQLSESDGALTTIYTYDFAGRKIGEQSGYRQIYYEYDDLNRLRSTKEGDTEVIEEYNVLDQLIVRTKSKEGILQSKEEYSYDEEGNQTQIINSQGITESSFNTEGKPLQIIDPFGFVTKYHYSYDTSFSKVITDPNGIQTFTIYDARDREILSFKKNQKEELIQKNESSYDQCGNRITHTHTIYSGLTPCYTLTHLWEYGPMGRIERFLESGIRETRYLYDEKGRLQTVVKPNKKSLHHEYDDLGRLSRFYTDEFDYQYSYDQNDRILAIEDKVSKTKTTRSYDDLGNILQETLGSNLTLLNEYDPLSRRIQCILPGGSIIYYSYDGFYLYQVEKGKYIHTYKERNLEGQVVKEQLSTGEEVLIKRDKLGRYSNLNSPYFTASYEYDGNGNLLTYRYLDPIGQEKYYFTYDGLNQLIRENEHTYQFDSLYNRLQKDGLVYVVDSFFQINHDGNKSYVYDDCGNLISDGLSKFFYDTLNRLIAIEKDNERFEYSYDPFNRRLSKISFLNGKRVKNTRYIWDGDHEIGTIDEQNKIEELRILGEGLGAEIGSAILYEIKGKSYIPVHDHRGSLVVLVDLKIKRAHESYRYNAFGEELTFNQFSPWRFASKRVDEESGLLFFGRRYYSPLLGRFITHDPEGFEDGPNLYAYLKNNPMADFDPYGLFSWRETYRGTKDFIWGGVSYIGGGLYGMASGIRQFSQGVGELGGTALLSMHFQDVSYFQNSWSQSRQTLSHIGRGLRNDPFGTIAPGFAEAWRNPTHPGAWGKAAVDVGLFAFSASKMGNATRVGSAGRIGESLTSFTKFEFASVNRTITPLIKSDFYFTEHGLQRAIQRGVTKGALEDTLNYPLKIRDIKIDQLGRPSQRFIGKKAEVVINPQTKQIISVNPTSTKKMNKLIK